MVDQLGEVSWVDSCGTGEDTDVRAVSPAHLGSIAAQLGTAAVTPHQAAKGWRSPLLLQRPRQGVAIHLAEALESHVSNRVNAVEAPARFNYA